MPAALATIPISFEDFAVASAIPQAPIPEIALSSGVSAPLKVHHWPAMSEPAFRIGQANMGKSHCNRRIN